jgi:hypothetical protein
MAAREPEPAAPAAANPHAWWRRSHEDALAHLQQALDAPATPPPRLPGQLDGIGYNPLPRGMAAAQPEAPADPAEEEKARDAARLRQLAGRAFAELVAALPPPAAVDGLAGAHERAGARAGAVVAEARRQAEAGPAAQRARRLRLLVQQAAEALAGAGKEQAAAAAALQQALDGKAARGELDRLRAARAQALAAHGQADAWARELRPQLDAAEAAERRALAEALDEQAGRVREAARAKLAALAREAQAALVALLPAFAAERAVLAQLGAVRDRAGLPAAAITPPPGVVTVPRPRDPIAAAARPR